MYIESFAHHDLHIQKLAIDSKSCCFYGRNRSGVEVLLHLLHNNAIEYQGIFTPPKEVGMVTFQRQQEIFAEELYNDNSDFMDKSDYGTLARQFLSKTDSETDHLLQTLNMTHCLDTGYRQLSSGEGRKLLLLMELLGDATTLVLQNPYDGLDKKSRQTLNTLLKKEAENGRQLLLFLSDKNDIPAWCEQIVIISDGQIAYQGKVKYSNNVLSRSTLIHDIQIVDFRKSNGTICELVHLKDGFASYCGTTIFSGLNLRICDGEHTLVTGANGSGKSTLFEIITGDSPLCYQNDLRIFGRQRGSGESIWDIKKEMGIVSPSLHRNHWGVGTVLRVVTSGFFDSIGLYSRINTQEKETARKWLTWAGLTHIANTPFRKLDYGTQRLVLITRALVKEPRLLMLDEPTQGLDDMHRSRLIDLLEYLTERKRTTIFYVSHRDDEYRSFFRQQIVI